LFGATVDRDKKIGPYLVFFLIVSVQIGVGILSFQTSIVKDAGHDAWISIILAGFGVHIILFLLYKLLHASNGDLVTIHNDLFGKWIGGFVNGFFIFYYSLFGLTVTRSYIEIIQTWMFPELSTWGFNLVLLPLIFYIVNGGFRTVVGICYFGAVLPAYLLLVFIFPLEYSELGNILPIFDHTYLDILKSTKSMTLSYLGFSTVLLFSPYVQERRKSQKWAHLGVATTTLVYLYIAIISFSYFSMNQIKVLIWPTLALWKIIELPFVERFEYIGLSSWLIVVLPNICLFVWCACRIGERVFRVRRDKWCYGILFIYFIAAFFINDHEKITLFSKIVSEVGFYVIVGYLPLLTFTYLIVKKMRGKK
jgi:spore germination protein AB